MINEATRQLVRDFEGLRLRAYLCPAGRWTIGYGHTSGVTEGHVITREEAERLLEQDLNEAAEHVDRLIRVPLTDNQRGALTSLVLNIGALRFMSSTLRQVLNDGRYDAVPEQIRRWNKARHPTTGQMIVLPGLARRREAEVALWMS